MIIKRTLAISVLLTALMFAAAVSWTAAGASAAYPGEHWQVYQTSEEAGWSSERLAEAKARFDETGAAAVMVIYDGRILVAWGDVTRRFMCHSVRKSFLSGLYGVYVDAGAIDVDDTLADLGIDDISPLSDPEKEARVRDLLKARSGVYHSAAYETPAMKKRRPRRGSHQHDTFWYYNNWDFNVLGAIFEQETGRDIFEAFAASIAGPLQMEDYRVMDGYHHLEPEHSKYPAYPFKMSARDMARFGLLFLREGEWSGEQVISRGWIVESTTSYSSSPRGGYAYLWWTDVPKGRPNRYFALGYGGHVIGVWPAENIVIVQRVDTYRGKRVSLDETVEVLGAVMAAKTGDPAPHPAVATFDPAPRKIHTVRLRREKLNRYAKTYPVRNGTAAVTRGDEGLVLESPFYGNFRLFPLSKNIFFVEDLEYYAVFDFEGGDPEFVTLHATRDLADLYMEIVTDGADAALRRYKAGGGAADEYAMNELGYELMGSGRLEEAIAVFRLNAENHPESSNAHDSLGEAYVESGDREAAVRCLEKALELDPDNGDAMQKLERLGVPVNQ